MVKNELVVEEVRVISVEVILLLVQGIFKQDNVDPLKMEH